MRPVSGTSNPAISRSKVVLPQPDGPNKAKKVLLSTLSETSSTAAIAPKCFDTAVISSSAMKFADAVQGRAGSLSYACAKSGIDGLSFLAILLYSAACAGSPALLIRSPVTITNAG